MKKTEKLAIQTAACLFLSILFCCCGMAWAELTLPDVFNDGMVLQRGMAVPVWGTADSGETVTVSFAGQTKQAKAGHDGRWSVKLDRMKAGGPFEMLVKARESVRLTDVMVGDVWLCSGQSNMWWPMKFVKDIPAEYKPEANDAIRLFSVWSPEHDNYGRKPIWSHCSPEVLGEFSAVAYFFGREIQRETGVTVGLVHSSMGGSVPETWMRRETLLSDPDFAPIVAYWDSITTAYPTVKRDFAAYLEGLKQFKAGKAAEPEKPDMPFIPKPLRYYMRYPQGIYDAQLSPLIPFAIKGVIWYQGESSTERAWQYRRLFPAMIGEWRHLWGQGDFPFIFTQLANYNSTTAVPEIREAQLMTLSLPSTAMAVVVDIGDSTNVHANNKWEVGRRLSLAALHEAYGRDIEYSGPIFDSMKIRGGSISLSFKHCADDLVAGKGGELHGFEIAGQDRAFHPAKARIDGSQVIVSSDAVEKPAAVRYGWRANPYCNLYNSVGLPASPFRSDNWDTATYGRLSP